MGTILRQSICSGIVCVLCLSIGLIYTWPSSTIKLFGSANTTLNRPMSETELSLFGSLSSVGALVSTPLAGVLLDTLGRKYCTLVASLTHVIAWSMISFCNQVEVVLTAVFISGLGGVVFLVVTVYIAEFCEESIRGTMSSLTMVVYSIGMLISYLLGGLLSYYMMIYICLSISVIGVVLISFMKESPVLLMKKGLEEEAAKSIAFFKDKKVNSKAVQDELVYLRKIVNPDLDDNEEETMKLKPEGKTKEKLSIWQFVKKSESTRRAFYAVGILCTLSFLQGFMVVQVYAEPLFQEAVPNISPTVCTVTLAVVNILGGFVTAYLIEAAGRRFLMIYSSIFSGVCCVVLGSQLQFQWGPHIMTAILIYIFCITYSVGAGTVPYVMVAEVFLPEIKSIASTILVEYCWLLNFVVLFIFNPLVNAIGLGPVFYIFATICFLTPIYCNIWMPETKGLQVDAIQLLFAPKRRRDLAC